MSLVLSATIKSRSGRRFLALRIDSHNYIITHIYTTQNTPCDYYIQRPPIRQQSINLFPNSLLLLLHYSPNHCTPQRFCLLEPTLKKCSRALKPFPVQLKVSKTDALTPSSRSDDKL